MYWTDAIKEYTQALQPIKSNPALIQRLISLIDLTSLNSADTEASIATFCEKAHTSFGHVAAVCVYPGFVRQVVAQFVGTSIKVATVVNFPEGNDKLEDVLIEIGHALQDGAQEIDVVFPYTRYLAGERQYAHTFVQSCKAACGDNVVLKVILETGALIEPSIIADASYDALTSGADFIKTSTGKLSEGATLEAAATMLLVIRHTMPQLKHAVGLKVSGGIREIAQAAQYVELADKIIGREWVNANNFRIGASKLVDEMIKENAI
jgi:deoxyribose-phosphate aldolase